MTSWSKSITKQIEKAVKDNPDALVALLSSDGVILYASPSVETILGYRQGYGVGHNITEYFKPADITHIRLTIQDALLTEESVPTTRNTPLKSGGWIRMRGALKKLVDETTGIAYVLSIARPAESAPSEK